MGLKNNYIFLSLIYLFSSTVFADATLDKFDDFLKDKISKQDFIQHLNTKEYLAFVIKDIEVTDTGSKKKIKWYLKEDKYSNKPIKLAKSTYNNPVSKSRLLKTLESLKSYRKVSRAIASVPQQEHMIAQKRYKHHKPVLSAGLMMGQVLINNSDKELRMNLVKATGSYRMSLGEDYSVTANFSAVRFLDVYYSNGASSESFDENVYEYGVDFTRTFEKYTISAGYNLLNYIILSDETVTDYIFNPTQLNRFSGKGSYLFQKDVNLSFGAGFLTGEGISGFDFFIGLGYTFGKEQDMQISPGYYRSILNIDGGGQDQSSAITFSFGASF